MHTNFHIRQHSKALAILEMIQTVNNRIADQKSTLAIYRNNVATGNIYSPLNLFNSEKKIMAKIIWARKVADRLENYYSSTLDCITSKVLS